MIRPGVTGWPQVRYDYAGSKEGQLEKFQYELFYLQNAFPLLDVFIIIKTLQKAILRRVSEVNQGEPSRSMNLPSL
jgi:lipopolysaccharide/colanic/teichoic acid biosynthesis glycosyltransferase